MGKKHFSEEQIAFALKQAESGTSAADLSLDKKMLQDVLSKNSGPPIGQTNESWSMDFTPAKPTDNAVIESFNGLLRDECLNQYWFLSLDAARAVTEAWREDYSRVRPHGALGNRKPSKFARPAAWPPGCRGPSSSGHFHLRTGVRTGGFANSSFVTPDIGLAVTTSHAISCRTARSLG